MITQTNVLKLGVPSLKSDKSSLWLTNQIKKN